MKTSFFIALSVFIFFLTLVFVVAGAKAHTFNNVECFALIRASETFVEMREQKIPLEDAMAMLETNIAESRKSSKAILKDADDLDMVRHLLAFVYSTGVSKVVIKEAIWYACVSAKKN